MDRTRRLARWMRASLRRLMRETPAAGACHEEWHGACVSAKLDCHSMRRKLLPAFAVVALSGATALAGSFTSNFSDPNQLGFTLTSSGARPNGDPFAPVVENGHLVLAYTRTANKARSSWMILMAVRQSRASRSASSSR
jgi:hypothetical protein